jgi:hypothetical protein
VPTSNPRVNVTLNANQYELLSRLGKAQGRSRSAVLVDLLETVTPMLERVVVAIEAAQRVQVQAREGFRKSVDDAEEALLPHVQAAMGQFDWLVEQATSLAGVVPYEPVERPTRAAAGGVVDAPGGDSVEPAPGVVIRGPGRGTRPRVSARSKPVAVKAKALAARRRK